MTLYEYRPLETRSTIRFLELHPPEPDDQALRVSLRHELLDENGASYEALSYTWGSSQITFDLQCIDGTKFTITENLHAALTALRLSDKSRVLWVDALCINQLDVLEKNVQVPLMRDIYKNASSVIIYLGDEADDSQLSMEYAESLYTQVALELVSAQDMACAILLNKVATLAPPPNKDIARAVAHLVIRPWFHRAWIVQEFAVAKIATFVCGSSTCHWAAPYFAWSELRQHHIDMESLLPTTVHTAGIHNILQLAEIRAGQLLGITQPLEVLAPKALLMSSKLPHDKLYSLLGVSDDVHVQKEESLRPRYDLPAEAVYCAYASWMASTQQGCLRLLSLAQVADRQLELPSWVPDWTAGKYRESLDITFRLHVPQQQLQPERLWFDASAASSSNTVLKPFIPELRNGHTLVVRGMIRDTVLGCSPPYRMSSLSASRPNLYRAVRDAQRMSRGLYNEIKVAMGDTEMPAELDPDIFVRRLLLYRTSNDRAAPGSWKEKFNSALEVLRPVFIRNQRAEIMAESEGGWQKLRELLGHEEMKALCHEIMEYTCPRAKTMEAFRLYQEDWAFYGALQQNTAGMALCRTLTGSLALVPDTAREHDRICIISGAAVPFVLRPLEDEGEQNHNFQLIGEAVIPGKMHGEYVTEGDANIGRLFSGNLFDLEEVDICIK